EEGLRLVAARGRLMQELPATGAMISVGASVARIAALLERYASEVSLAAINGPESIVLSGVSERIAAIASRLRGQGIECKRMHVSHAFHSPLMDPMLDAFEAAAANTTLQAPRIPILSNVSGGFASADELRTARYWRRHVRQPVLFSDC